MNGKTTIDPQKRYVATLLNTIDQLVDCLELWRDTGSECARMESGETACTECDGVLLNDGVERPSFCDQCGTECECPHCYDLIVLRKAYRLLKGGEYQ